MYVTSTHTHMQTLYVHVHVCMSVCNWWLPVFGLDWAPTLQWGRGRLICTCCVGSPSLAPRPHFVLPLLRVASTCAEANDDHSVRNAPEAAQKPIDYYLPHYISSFRDVSSEQIISFVRLDTFKVKRGGERKRSYGPGTDPGPGPGPFGQTGLTGRQMREQEREKQDRETEKWRQESEEAEREVNGGICRHSWLHTPCTLGKDNARDCTRQQRKEKKGEI